MSTGAVYGNGIYMAADSNTSISYARGGVGWNNSILNESGNETNIQVMALCEVVAAGYKVYPLPLLPSALVCHARSDVCRPTRIMWLPMMTMS